ncbi:hypothetical protein R1sor_020448 [Riccia sorocarpa]|uniref:mitogen-activated protein kinase kinase kinase n=1 Tax=Riccia sorocarpa TaxID=122646 RepID=A0ABD3IG52_9MARC
MNNASFTELLRGCWYSEPPAPGSLGVTREVHVIGSDSVSSQTSDFTFDDSLPPSNLPASLRDVFFDACKAFNAGIGHESGNYDVISSPSARGGGTADASSGENRTEGQEHVQETLHTSATPEALYLETNFCTTDLLSDLSFSEIGEENSQYHEVQYDNCSIEKTTPTKLSECERAQRLVFPWSKGELLGAGSFAVVYEAVDSNGSFFAVKEVSLVGTDKMAQQCVKQLEQEMKLLSRLKHDNIVQYLGTERTDEKLCMFLELIRPGSLASLCKKFRLANSELIAYTGQILKGLKYLHDMNVVHRDIKGSNILVDVKGTCKLADFGLSKQISALDQIKSCKGSAYWMAPEVIDPKKTSGVAADIWSLGCTVLEMVTGSPPFGDMEWYEALWKVGRGEAPPIPDDLSEDAKDFIGQCLQVDPSKRPTATALLQHRFLSANMTSRPDNRIIGLSQWGASSDENRTEGQERVQSNLPNLIPHNLPASRRDMFRDASKEFSAGVEHEPANHGAISSPSARDGGTTNASSSENRTERQERIQETVYTSATSEALLDGNRILLNPVSRTESSDCERIQPFVFPWSKGELTGSDSFGTFPWSKGEPTGSDSFGTVYETVDRAQRESTDLPSELSFCGIGEKKSQYHEIPYDNCRIETANTTKSSDCERIQPFVFPWSKGELTGSDSFGTFPWSKGELTGSDSFGTVYETVDRAQRESTDLPSELSFCGIGEKKSQYHEIQYDNCRIETANTTKSREIQCERIQPLVFPWSKGELTGADSFGTVYEAVDRSSLSDEKALKHKCVEVNSAKRHTDTERLQPKFPVISPQSTMTPETKLNDATDSSHVSTTDRDIKQILKTNQRECLPLHSTGPLPYVSCEHCRVLLKIPFKLLQTLQSKPEAKLRCGGCRKISVLSGLSPEPRGPRDAGIATSSSKSRTMEGSCAVPRLDARENEGATRYSASSSDEASSTGCPSTDGRSSLPSISVVQSIKTTVKISGSSNIDFYRELQSNLQARRTEGAGSGLIELPADPTPTVMDEELLGQEFVDCDVETSVCSPDNRIVGLSQTCAKWEMTEASGSLMDVGFITKMDGDRSQWQAASSCTCPPLRPDVLAFGFKTFHDVYDPTRLLCCYHVLGDAVEILFFHVQGMAAFIGVGLPFSRVLLREDLTVEISELRLQTWLDCWSEEEMANFTLLLHDSTKFENQRRTTSVSSIVQPLSAEQAAERFGIGTEGESLVMLPVHAFQPVLPDSELVPPSWIGSFYQFVKVTEKGGATKSETASNASNDTPPSETMSGSLQYSASSYLGESSKRYGENEMGSLSQGKELLEVGVLDQERRNQPLQLTVIIYLDGDNCTYCNAVDRSEFRLDRQSSQLRFVHSGSGEDIMDMDPLLCDFVIEPKLTVNFLYYPHLEGNGSKKMKTRLDVEFLIDGNVSDPDEFGWFHDQLRVSFKCTRPNEVRREGTEIISTTEMRTADRGHGRENSTLSLKGKGKEAQVFAGHRTFASLQLGMTSKEESSTGCKTNQESSMKIPVRCLVDASFSLQQKGGAAELAYLATIFPPFNLYEVWDPVDRDLAQSSGIMSAVPVKVGAGWAIREDESNSDGSNNREQCSNRFCKYELSCQRDLKVLRRKHVERPSTVRRGFLPRSRPRPKVIIDIEETSIKIQQKLGRSFLVNHSFSHMQRTLLRPHPYEWNTQAPCPRPVDQMIH